MARNIEIKAAVPDLETIRTRVMAFGPTRSEILHQTDTFFLVSQGRLKVRQFSDGSGELIYYQRPDQVGPKESIYHRVFCEDARTLSAAFQRALPVRATVRKRREVFLVGSTRVHLDQVEQLGSFVELEVVLRDDQTGTEGEQIAVELLGALQIPAAALIAESYIDLIERSFCA